MVIMRFCALLKLVISCPSFLPAFDPLLSSLRLVNIELLVTLALDTPNPVTLIEQTSRSVHATFPSSFHE